MKTTAEQAREAVFKYFVAGAFREPSQPDEIEIIVDKIIEVWTVGGFPNPPSEEEIRAIIEGWRKSGRLESETLELLGPLSPEARSEFQETDDLVHEGSQELSLLSNSDCCRLSTL